MNKGMEAQGIANLQDSDRLTLAYRKEPKMTDETDRRGEKGKGKIQVDVLHYCITVRANEIKVGK
jgi:hypothetical protein